MTRSDSTSDAVRSAESAARPRGKRVIFAGGNGYPPEANGGVQSSTHDLACRLIAVGYDPAVLAPLYGDGWFGFVARVRLKLSGSGTVRDNGQGYPVYRAWFPAEQVDACIRQFRPDVAIVQCHGTVPIARNFRAAGVPVVIYLRNVELDELGGDLNSISDASFIANSKFTARRYAERFGIDATVVPPTINPGDYETESDGSFVTFVNPVAEKGVEVAIAIAARCPDIPFLFTESWLLKPADLGALTDAIHPHSNIRFERRTRDMKSVYQRTRIVLAPSMWEEAWGRIASEAHCSGIPVVGSNRGGLPEAIGSGGVILEHDAPIEQWVVAVRRLWFEPDTYAEVSEAARLYSRREELDPETQFKAFLSVIEAAVSAQ